MKSFTYLFFLQSFQALLKRENQPTYVLRINNDCFNVSYDEQKVLLEMEYLRYLLIDKNGQLCQDLSEQDKMLIKSKDSLKLNHFHIYKYGNWCGPNYGGLDQDPKPECVEICHKDIMHVSDECRQCLPPIDYLDENCMFHDFCYSQHDELHIGSNICRTKSHDIAREIGYPCMCQMPIVFATEFDKLYQNCHTVSCIWNGMLVHEAFDNLIFQCSCEYEKDGKKIEKCISPYQCKNKGGN